ncbi:hypothetical protein CLG96_05945 [Sphingomonas oleivorans]|uniref:Uncharacterized protein n=1 Tax=Sphingomonas oleivorans TaxID=1735121 RepID=A0A2T5FZH6_9SPHN|nr:hypothetical protein [Sphingomonas oleivorans]PTQ12106.1 hypothetical protein CLG96_05945 [Sphingomonas oleivorans]
MPAAGTTMAYRPKPRDFRETFIRVGWSGIEAHYNAHKKTIVRWMEEEGRDELIEARRQVTGYGLKRGSRRSDYVLGKRMRAQQGDAGMAGEAPVPPSSD